jgi:eukaryotic-like serine/threonine-protein kinase
LLLERYMIFRIVADGGMGRVYEALDQQGKRQVALKILHAEVAKDPISIERFKREYEVSRTLPHEHIVDVLDFRPTQDGSFVLVMEYLQGEELRATLKRQKTLSEARAVRLLSQLALALAPAHALGLVHRDLKPDNIFLCQTNEGDVVKVLDFGSVKQRAASKQLTVLGTTIGSPFYMSPEQAQGLASLDQRADVWAVTAILYELLSGRLPFNGTNAPSILLEILAREPLPLTKAAEPRRLPTALDAVIAAGLDKDPEHRTPSVAALADAVGKALGLPLDHRRWAQMAESALGEEIERARSRAAPSVSPDAAEQFFRQVATSDQGARLNRGAVPEQGIGWEHAEERSATRPWVWACLLVVAAGGLFSLYYFLS